MLSDWVVQGVWDKDNAVTLSDFDVSVNPNYRFPHMFKM